MIHWARLWWAYQATVFAWLRSWDGPLSRNPYAVNRTAKATPIGRTYVTWFLLWQAAGGEAGYER